VRTRRKEEQAGLVAILALTLGFLFFIQGYPLLWSFFVSFTDQKIGGEGAWSGLDNYLHLAGNRTFWMAMEFTFIYVVTTVFFKLIGGFVMALTLNQPLRGRSVFRALLFLPWALPTLTSVLAWRWMLGDIGGIVNWILQQLHLIERPVGWLAEPSLARLSVALVNIWRGIPFFGISLLAGLQAVSPTLYEAAIIDGANAPQRMFYVTIPQIRGIILLVTLISTIWTMGDFAVIWIMTRGGPADTTHVFSTLSYLVSFQNLEVARGIAVSVFVVPLAFAIMFFTMRLIESRRE
jgi:multiple sugar transport system permease protein